VATREANNALATDHHDQEGAVKLPRFRIAWAMVFVAIAALNLGAIRAWSDIMSTGNKMLSRGPKHQADFDRILNTLLRADLLVTGALPMGNILAVGLMIHRRRRNRPFLSGFEAFGATALALYIAGVSCSTNEELRPYLDLVHGPLRKSFGPSITTAYTLTVYSIFVMILVPPQMAFALIGGFLFRRFRDDRATRPNPVPMGQ
jgi:hypothetical protein